jgi:hypothetical protein
MVPGVCRSPRNGELRFGQPGGSLVKLGEGKERGGLGLLIGAGTRRIWQGIVHINAGEKSLDAEFTRMTGAKRKKTLTGWAHLSVAVRGGVA